MKNKPISRELWKIAEGLRDQGRNWDLLEIAKLAVEQGVILSYGDLDALARKRHLSGYIPTPEPAIEFIAQACKAREVRSLLDPWAVNPYLVSSLTHALETK